MIWDSLLINKKKFIILDMKQDRNYTKSCK